MPAFQGHLNSGKIQNHIYTSNDESLESIGLSSFTLESCSSIWNANLDNINFILARDYAKLDSKQTIISHGIKINVNGVLEYYDDNNNIQKITKPEIDWIELIYYHEDRILKKVGEDKVKDATLSAIKKSACGGVKFEFEKTIFQGVDPDPDPEQNKRYIILKFFTRNLENEEENDKDTRRVGLSSAVPIVTVPQTPAGTPYSPSNTTNAANGDNTGRKVAPSEGGINNPVNTAAAPLDTYLNPNTGKLESGNRRMIAIIMTDIDPAPIQEFPLSLQDLDLTTPEGYISSQSDYSTSFVPTGGAAVPLSVQLQNKNIQSPNFVKKCIVNEDGSVTEGYGPEQVTIVNRFNKTFKKGDRVFLTRIDNEWVPEKVEPEVALSQIKLGEWAFIKLIADSDNYFKDTRFSRIGNESVPFSSDITPEVYEANAKTIFYYNIKDKINPVIVEFNDIDFHDNLVSSDADYNDAVQPSQRYFISTVFDQLSQKMGGLTGGDFSVISKTNFTKEPQRENGPYMNEAGFFWGPVYVDGYRKIVQEITNTSLEVSGFLKDRSYFSNQSFTVVNKPESLLRTSQVVHKENSSLTTSKEVPNPASEFDVMTVDETISIYEPTINDIPAECTSKIIDPLKIFTNYNKLGVVDTSGLVNIYLTPPYGKSVKTSLNNIQFVPLTANLAAHNDPLANVLDRYDRSFYLRAKEYLENYLTLTAKEAGGLWGKMFDRIASTDISNPIVGIWPHTVSMYSTQYFNCNNLSSLNYNFPQKLVTYDCYIRKSPTNPALGGLTSLFDDSGPTIGANCVGIICGKNSVKKRNGGQINFEVTSKFGFNPFKTVSGGQVNLGLLVLGGIPVPFLNSNPVRENPGIPQFGSKNDSLSSFGNMALFVRIFDSWPEELTVFDPRSFGVLHFNPGVIASLAKSVSTKVIDPSNPNEKITIQVDEEGTAVDFRVPTYNTLSTKDNTIAPYETIIDDSNKNHFRPKTQWRVNTIRRGMLLSGGGFNYSSFRIQAHGLAIYVDPAYPNIQTGEIESKTMSGKGYAVGETLVLRNNLKIVPTSLTPDGGIVTFDIVDAGDFNISDVGIKLSVPKPSSSGSEAAIMILSSLIINSIVKNDSGPVEHVPPTRISASSKSGTAEVNETTSTQFDVEKNSLGSYDIFTHFHNDIGTAVWSYILNNNPPLSYINMKIT